MSTSSPVNDYGVIATLTVNTNSEATAQTAATTAVGDMNTALRTLAENVGISFSEIEPASEGQIGAGAPTGLFEWAELDGQTYSVQGQLTVGATDPGTAQTVAEAAQAAINTAISGVSPAVTVTLESENGQYIFNQMQ